MSRDAIIRDAEKRARAKTDLARKRVRKTNEIGVFKGAWFRKLRARYGLDFEPGWTEADNALARKLVKQVGIETAERMVAVFELGSKPPGFKLFWVMRDTTQAVALGNVVTTSAQDKIQEREWDPKKTGGSGIKIIGA